MLVRKFRLATIRRLLLIVAILASILLSLTIVLTYDKYITKVYYWLRPDKGVYCHSMNSTNSLPDISDASPRKGESIFFHETSCSSHLNGKTVINSRQACAVESAARLNPEYEVYLLYASPGDIQNENTESDRFLFELLKYSNVHILHVDMERYMRGSPVENLWKNEELSESQFAQSHTSDVLRFLTLWKYGGIYLDLDVIVTKKLADLGTDFAGAESNTSIAAGIIGFNHKGRGHDLVTSCLDDLRRNFNGNDWGYNGPGTITRLLRNICDVSQVIEMHNKSCQGFKVYPPSEFYAIPWWNWKWFLDDTYFNTVVEYTKNSHLIHVWNRFSSSTKIPLDSDTPYLHFAKEYCPSIVSQCDEYF